MARVERTPILIPAEDGQVRAFTQEQYRVISERLLAPYTGERSTDFNADEVSEKVALGGILKYVLEHPEDSHLN